MKIASALRTMSSRSAVTSPRIRTARPGPGNGWRRRIASGRPRSRASCAHLVLEQRSERLEKLEPELGRQAADVVVALDVGRPLAARGLDDVGVEGSLGEEAERAAYSRLATKDGDELAADDSPLLLRVLDAPQRAEEPRRTRRRSRGGRRADAAPPRPRRARPRAADRGRRRRPGGPRPHAPTGARAPTSRRRRRRRRGRDLVPTRSRTSARSPLERASAVQSRGTPASVEEALEHRRARRGVDHLGVELHAEQPPVRARPRRRRGSPAVAATTSPARGSATTDGRVAHPHGGSSERALEAGGLPCGRAGLRRTTRRPASRTSPPKCCTRSCIP